MLALQTPRVKRNNPYDLSLFWFITILRARVYKSQRVDRVVEYDRHMTWLHASRIIRTLFFSIRRNMIPRAPHLVTEEQNIQCCRCPWRSDIQGPIPRSNFSSEIKIRAPITPQLILTSFANNMEEVRSLQRSARKW